MVIYTSCWRPVKYNVWCPFPRTINTLSFCALHSIIYRYRSCFIDTFHTILKQCIYPQKHDMQHLRTMVVIHPSNIMIHNFCVQTVLVDLLLCLSEVIVRFSAESQYSVSAHLNSNEPNAHLSLHPKHSMFGMHRQVGSWLTLSVCACVSKMRRTNCLFVASTVTCRES